jgi:galactose oxidase
MKLLDRFRAALFAAVAAGAYASAHAEVTSVPYGGVIASHSGKCLAVEGGSRTPGARIVQASCDGRDARQMHLKPGGDGYHVLVARNSSQCVNVPNASPIAGAQVVQGSCTAADTTRWALTAVDGGFSLKAMHSGMCLDVDGAGRADGTALIQYPCKVSANQTFQFERAVFSAHTPAAIMSQQSGQCIDVPGNSSAAATGIQQSACKGGAGQQWRVQAVGDGTVWVMSVLNGMCLDVEANSTAPGAAVVQFGCHGRANQQWRLQDVGNAWRLVSVNSVMCLALEGSTSSPGSRLVQAPCENGKKSELWTLHVPTLPAVWSNVVKTDVDAVAAANLPDGRILTWAAEDRLSFGDVSGVTYTEILDPIRGTGSTYRMADTGHNMFCPGTGMLPDGRILVNGGIAETKTSIFDPRTNRWSTAAPMSIGRGYQGSVVNPDGSVFTLGGSWSGERGGKMGELWSEKIGWSMRPGIPPDSILTLDNQGIFRADNQLWLQVLSGGRLLHAGPSKQMNWIDVAANGGPGSIARAGPRGDDADSMNGSLTPFGADIMLKTGGAPHYQDAYATTSAQVIDARGNGLGVERVAPMAYARAYHSSVVLPTGHVMVVGGQTYPVPFSDDNAILVPEMWDPVTRVFERMPAMVTPRTYHSVALLMADGRVWAAGGGLCGGCSTNHPDYEILTPPYLLNGDGTPAARPTITGYGPMTGAKPGGSVVVTTSEPVVRFALMRLSSVTHTLNNDQRRIELFAENDGSLNYTLTLPYDAGILVPGYYMLFAINAKGVPSVSQPLQVAAR